MRRALTLVLGAAAAAGGAPAYYTVTTLAGGGLAGNVSGSVNGRGTSALFYTPFGVAVSSVGTVYVADGSNNKVRSISPGGAVATLAGGGADGKTPGAVNGVGTSALFNYPYCVAAASTRTVYVADTTNGRVRAIARGKKVTTLPFNFSYPYSVAAASFGTIYVADTNNNEVRAITPDGAFTLASGFNLPRGVAVDSAGTVYVADTNNNKVCVVSPGGAVATLAGGGADGVTYGSADGVGSNALFWCPSGVAVDSEGVAVYVADFYNHKVRLISRGGAVVTIAGGGADGMTHGSVNGLGTAALFFNPSGIAVDSVGTVYVADCHNNKLRKLVPPTPTPSSKCTPSATSSPQMTGTAAPSSPPSGTPLPSPSPPPSMTCTTAPSSPPSDTPLPSLSPLP